MSNLNTRGETPSDGELRRTALSSRRVRVVGASALVAGFAIGGVGVASATTHSGASSATSTANARSGGHGRHLRVAAEGTVETVGTNTFTVKGRDGTVVTVDVTSSTTYKDPGVTSPTIANVTTGERVAVEGTTASGVVTATSVFIGFGHGAFGHGAFGHGGFGHGHGHASGSTPTATSAA